MQFTITDLYAHMGLFARLIVFVLGIMSVLSLVVMAERLVVFNKSRSESRNFAERMAAVLSKAAYDLLHQRYPDTTWSKNTKYWYGANY